MYYMLLCNYLSTYRSGRILAYLVKHFILSTVENGNISLSYFFINRIFRNKSYIFLNTSRQRIVLFPALYPPPEENSSFHSPL